MSTTDRDTTRIVRSWLDDGATRLPDRVLDAVLDQVPATPQRRVTWWPVRRLTTMNNAVKYGLAAAVVAIAALLGFNYLVAPNIGSPGLGDPTPTPISTLAPSPTPVAVLNNQDPLSPGRYQADPLLPATVTVDVPAGWSAIGNAVITGPGGNDAPGGISIRFYPVGNLFNNPSSYADGLLDPPVGPTVDDLVQAIVDQSEWISSTPIETSIDGYPARLVTITIPDDAEFDTSKTPNGAFYLFQDTGSGQLYGWAQGQTFDVYAVDVDGERIVVEAFHYPGTTGSDLQEQQAVLDTLQIEPAP